MKKTAALIAVLVLFTGLYAGEITLSDSASFDINSKTTFGVNLDDPYRFGLKQELTNFSLTIGLAPYQKLSNRVTTDSAVGFIDLTFFNLDLLFKKPLGYNGPGNATTNRFQTGEFVAGIAKGNWLFQMNAGGNEPFFSPWNKGLNYVNDKIKFSWAYMDSVLDIDRTKLVSELDPEDCVVTQYTQDNASFSDELGYNLNGNMIGVMYNKEDVFGIQTKFATQHAYDSTAITEDNRNGVAAGIDSVFMPVENLKIFTSVAGSWNYGTDSNDDPVMAGTKIGYSIPLNEDIELQPYVGFDGGVQVPSSGDVSDFEYEIAGGIRMTWPGQGGWLTDYIVGGEGRVFPGMALGYRYKDESSNLKFTLFEPKGDDGVFYGIGSEIIVDVKDIGNKSWQSLVTLYLDYTVAGVLGTSGKLVPWTTICYDNLQNGEKRLQAAKVDLGAKLDGVIPGTVLGLTWNSGDLESGVKGVVKASVEIAY